MEKFVKGSVLPLVIDINGLGQEITPDKFDISLTFYCCAPVEYEHPAHKTVEITNDDTENFFAAPSGDGSQFIAILDTSNLDNGEMICELSIEYKDGELNRQVMPIREIKTNIMIVSEKLV